MDERPLGSVASLVMGQSPRGEDCNDRADGIPLLNGPTEFGSHSPTPRQWTTDAKRTCHRGAVLLCVRGSTTGRTNRADQPYALGRGVAAIEADNETDQTYVFYALLARLGLLLERTTGSVFPNLSRDDIASLQVPWPNEAARSGISEVLGSIDDMRRANADVVIASTRLMATTFAALFAPALDAVAGRSPAPAGWSLEILGDWLSVLETGTRPKGGVSGILTGVPSVGAESIVDLGIYDYDKTRYVPDEFYAGMRRGHVEDRDVLLYKDGGRPGEFEPHVSMFGDDFPFRTFCINEHVYRLRARAPLTQEFLFSWLSTPPLLDEMRRRGTGVAIPGLNSTSVKLLPLIVPPRALVDELTATASELTRAVFAAGRENRTLTLLRATLLRALFSEKVRVRDGQIATVL